MTDKYHWMTEHQRYCADMLSGVMGGDHHVNGTFKPCGDGLSIHVYNIGRFGTADSDMLTRLVIRAHDAMVRVCFIPSGPRLLGMTLHRRFFRDSGVGKRHDTIETAILKHRAGLQL